MSGQAFNGELGAATRAILPSDVVTHVHLLRHGEVERMGARIVRGQIDAPLSAFGVEQGERLVDWFEARVGRLDALWSSDLSRCARLAANLGARLGVAPVLDQRLREQSMGAWEGRGWDEVSAAEPAAVGAYWSDYWNARPSGGESLREVQARALDAWRDLIARHAGGRVALVAHIGVIRGLLCALLGVDGGQALRFAPATASHTHILWSEAGAVLEVVGERPWMLAESAPPARAARLGTGSAARRVALAGSAGTGKTTLGRRLAAELGVPYIDELMRRRLEGGLRLDGLSRDAWRALVRDLWREQVALQAEAREGFVADRSSLDYAAFWLHYGLHEDAVETSAFFAEMAAASAELDAIVLFPWGVLPLVADGVRTPDPWTQLSFQGVLEGVLRRHARTSVLELLPSSDLEERLRWTRARLVARG
jgi:alpha-ribazole phosphatase/probable phosphoglycerate mutase